MRNMVAMFGYIYKNTQIHLIKDTGISYGLSFISPFGYYLIPQIDYYNNSQFV